MKRPIFWDSFNLISLLLIPLSLLTIIYNFIKSFSSKKYFKIKTICVGNIYLGGTGKTPTTIALFKIIQKLNLKVLTAKKFYKSQIDENIILDKKTKFISKKNRNMIIDEAVKSNHDVLIFDDGLQDGNIKYDLKIVCFDAENWIGNGHLIPAGPLREKIDSLKKYDIVFLKGECSNEDQIVKLIKNQNPEIKVFKTYYEVLNLNKFNVKNKYLIFELYRNLFLS